jgi:hypothetical protein
MRLMNTVEVRVLSAVTRYGTTDHTRNGSIRKELATTYKKTASTKAIK